MTYSHRALAERHVTRGREIVSEQRKIIKRLRAINANTTQATELLEAFERSQMIFEDDLAEIKRRASKA
jgi:hypothetical protein